MVHFALSPLRISFDFNIEKGGGGNFLTTFIHFFVTRNERLENEIMDIGALNPGFYKAGGRPKSAPKARVKEILEFLFSKSMKSRNLRHIVTF